MMVVVLAVLVVVMMLKMLRPEKNNCWFPIANQHLLIFVTCLILCLSKI